jgi:hypothetical protein
VTKYPTGRMLGGTGTLVGPSPNALFIMVVEFIKTHLSQFAESVLDTDIINENGLNSRLSRFITNAADQEIFFAERESMEDETRGNSPAADIGIFLKVDDIGIDPPIITVFEGKRLTTSLPHKRRREYVIGYEEGKKHILCGGIERFKLAIHGGKLSHAGMIGYLQDGTPGIWREKINSWISDLCSQPFNPAWSEREKLTPQMTDGRITECSSVVCREDSDLHLTHLWINLVP